MNRVRWKDRSHFLALAATAMRRVLVDYARRFRAAKRGGGGRAEPLSEEAGALPEALELPAERAEQMLVLDQALSRLASQDERLGRVVEMRFFGGMTVEETAQALDLAPSTVKLDWQKAKSWLYRELVA